jgi:hypothetical protein
VTPRLRLLLVALAVALAALVMAHGPKPPEAPAPAATALRDRPARALDPVAPVDPGTIRDVFRFEEPRLSPALRPAPRPAAAPAPTPASDLPKLVGLVRRQGRLLAAFAVEGDVVLAGPGDTAGGVSVLDVSEDGVRVRRKDGSEERLRVP